MTIEFKCEEHSEKAQCAMAQLSGHYKPGFIRQIFADMGPTIITLRQLTSKNKPREFSMTAAEADAFCEAWALFKYDIALWEAQEAEKKEQAAKAEQARQLAVWKEVEQLAGSIPGLEITAREETVWDEDAENGTTTVWAVKHEAVGYSDSYLYDVDQVLTSVQYAIEHYNQRLADCEEGEKENFRSWHSIAEMNAQKFLATHRAFVASKTAPLVDVNA